ncbi:putative cytochrome c-type biogenesis protein CcsBA [Flavobacterium longum]|uniref:cytochrome c biogenesis protein CcsA n=1 Tax=Flavobacterium longum TaxID=1299340 RepID=UPI0039E91B94
MLKKIGAFFFSTRLMAFLFIAYAAAMALGTFIENDYNTATARILIYNAWWFEAIMLLFLVNFIGNIKRYDLLNKKNWATLSLHVAFIFILIGAGITRYISYEGMMPIREGEASNQIFSEKPYLSVLVDGQYKGELRRRSFEEPLLLSMATHNDFKMSEEFADIPFTIEYKDFIMGATEAVQPDPKGVLFLKMVESGGGTRHEHFLMEGEVVNIHNLLFALNKPTKGAVNITAVGDKYTIDTPFEGMFMRMADQFRGRVAKDSVQPLMMRSLYNVGGAQFVFPELPVKGKKVLKSNGDWKEKNGEDALVVTVTSEGKSKTVTLKGARGKAGEPFIFKQGNLEYTLAYGSKVYQLPFDVKLNDFIASKYPGTEKSYSAFESRVTVLDGKDKFDARIYMNHVLDHKGYRFFQASFDPDEKGTVLSVNHDFWGTNITYAGYFLLFFGLMAILFTKHSRFADLKRKLEKVKEKKASLLTMLLLLIGLNVFGQQTPHGHGAAMQKPPKPTDAQIDEFLEKTKIDAGHAAKFGRMVIQDEGGRMKPVNTFSSELLRKVSKNDQFRGMNSDQVLLSMLQFRDAWLQIPIMYVKKDNDSLRGMLGIGDQKYAPFLSFFDDQFNYKLEPFLDAAYKAPVPNQFQKDIIDADRKVNLMNSALTGGILKVFPVPDDKNNKWVSYMELEKIPLTGRDTLVKRLLPVYMASLSQSIQSKDYSMTDVYLDGINKFQKKFGYKVMPSEQKIDSEILYNKYDVFKKLYYLYMITGVLMLLLTIVNIFVNKPVMRFIITGFHILIGSLFALHTLGLMARWYISGHAPWSDAYESMIYVAWATMFFTLAFDRKSKLTVASGTFVASMILMIAHWNWMDPAIANLQPVLNSYWLMIHVAVIVASYGPFTLGMVLGAVSLILMLFVNDKNREKMDLHIKEITYINEMALTIGLVMLTIGNFLGGQWANESWGRYWGWDPKETWALISIMVYAFVIHARLVPALRGRWTFNFMSVVAYYSILMTYFGVNFYLSGLHSYASGDKVVTPTFIYVSVACVFILGAVSFWRERKTKK